MNTAPEPGLAPAPAPDADEGFDTPGLAALTVTDRCDAPTCTAQAYVRAQLPNGHQLVFCGHHGHDLAPALFARGAAVRDDTWQLRQNRFDTPNA